MTNNIKLQLRLPDDLHEKLRRSASRHDRSLNGQILTFLRMSVVEDERSAGRRAREEVVAPVVATESASTPTPADAGTNGTATPVAPVAVPRPRRARRQLAAATA